MFLFMPLHHLLVKLPSEDFDLRKKISNSAVGDNYIPIPKHIDCPPKFTVSYKDNAYQCRLDKRRRLFVHDLFFDSKCTVGSTVRLTRKNDKYFFSIELH